MILALTVVEISGIISPIAALILAAVAVVRLPEGRGTLRISQEQGSAMIRDRFIEALQRDLERKNVELTRQDAVIHDLRDQIKGFEERFGTRRHDGKEDQDVPS